MPPPDDQVETPLKVCNQAQIANDDRP